MLLFHYGFVNTIKKKNPSSIIENDNTVRYTHASHDNIRRNIVITYKNLSYFLYAK